MITLFILLVFAVVLIFVEKASKINLSIKMFFGKPAVFLYVMLAIIICIC